MVSRACSTVRQGFVSVPIAESSPFGETQNDWQPACSAVGAAPAPRVEPPRTAAGTTSPTATPRIRPVPPRSDRKQLRDIAAHRPVTSYGKPGRTPILSYSILEVSKPVAQLAFVTALHLYDWYLSSVTFPTSTLLMAKPQPPASICTPRVPPASGIDGSGITSPITIWSMVFWIGCGSWLSTP